LRIWFTASFLDHGISTFTESTFQNEFTFFLLQSRWKQTGKWALPPYPNFPFVEGPSTYGVPILKALGDGLEDKLFLFHTYGRGRGATMSLASAKAASEPRQRLKQWSMDDGVLHVPQKTCQSGTGNGQLRIVFTLLSSACDQGGVDTSTTSFFLSFSGESSQEESISLPWRYFFFFFHFYGGGL
jgi:hypothetical protein